MNKNENSLRRCHIILFHPSFYSEFIVIVFLFLYRTCLLSKNRITDMNGAWFINSFLDAAQSYLDQDIDRIMTAVRHDLSCNSQYEGQNQECQISVSESTLTQLFYL